MPLDRLTKLDPLQLGRFRVLARLGGGGMGNVYLAEADDGTPAAVKVIRADLAQDTQFRARFRREVEAGRRVQNRCIARYLDADTFAASPWLATEFVPGPTLHHEVFAVGPVVGVRVIGLAAGLADALVAIHAAGLVHRDLKPANVLLAPEGPKVIDFGITLAVDATALTTTGTLVGSPAYMAPEQARGTKDVGAPADVFSWASCLTFASRGRPPFGDGEAAGLLYKVVHEPPDLTGVAPALLPFVRAALDKEAANRPTAAELVAGLTEVLGGAPAASLVAPPPEGGPPRVLVPLGVADAGRVLAVSWPRDVEIVEEAERTLAEAHQLRDALPPRAEERQRRERSRANRAVFAALLSVLVALLVVAAVVIRAGQDEVAEPIDNGLGPDAPTSTVTYPTAAAPAPDPSDGAAEAPVPAEGPPGPVGGAAPADDPAAAGPRPPDVGAPSTTAPSAAPPTAPSGTTPSSPVATAAPVTCTAEILAPAPGGSSNRLPTADASNTPSYELRVRASTSGFPAATLSLVRAAPASGQPAEAWRRDIAAAPGSTATVGRFAMRTGTAPTTGTNPVVHHEAAGTTFELQLRLGGRTIACGRLLGPP